MKYLFYFLLIPSILFGAQKIDNIVIDGNTILSADTNGNITLDPDGTGETTVTGNILVGDANGDSAHTIGGVSVQSVAEVHTSGGTDLGGLSVHRLVDSATLGAHVVGYKSRGTVGAETVVNSGDAVGRYVSAGYDGTDYELLAEIRTSVDNTPGAGDMPGRIGFFTSADGAASPIEAFRIDSSQNANLLTESELRYQDAAGGEYVGFKAPATVTSSQTYTLPAADGSVNEVLKTDGAGTLSWGTGGGGEGSKNYFSAENSKFEGNTVGDWTDGGSGSATLGETVNSTAGQILEGSYSLDLDKSAADGTGQYWEVQLDTIDRADYGRMLYGSFEYDATVDTDYAAGDIVIEVYDNTNSANLYCGETTDLELPAMQGKFNFACELNTNTADIRFRPTINSTSALAWKVVFDDFRFGPAAQITAPVETDWITFTPTGSMTNMTYEGRYRRVGSFAEIHYKGTFTGFPAAADFYFDMPSGLTLDTSKIYTGDSSLGVLEGDGQAVDDTNNNSFDLFPVYDGTNADQIQIYNIQSNGTYDLWLKSDASNPIIARNPDTYVLNVRVPIDGWSTGTVVNENEMTLKTIRVRAQGNAGTVLTSNTTPIDFDDEVEDTHNAWDGDQFTAPRSGRYKAKGFIRFTTSNTAAVSAYVDSTQTDYAGYTAASSSILGFNWEGYLNQGEVWELRVNAGLTLSDASDITHYIELQSVPDFTLLGVTKDVQTNGNSFNATASSVNLTDFYDVIHVDTSSNAVTLNLPTAVGRPGKTYKIILVDDTNAVTISANGSETIGGATADYVMGKNNDHVELVSDGTNWSIAGGSDIMLVSVQGNTGASRTANTDDIIWDDEVIDLGNVWAASTQFTAPRDGKYHFHGFTRWASGTVSAVRVYTNASTGDYVSYNGDNTIIHRLTWTENLNAGDAITFRATSTETQSDNDSTHYLRIIELR